jgi:anaerobic selenocysteine-containing dehydrogenase
VAGKPWDPSRKLIEWDGTRWSGYDVPDIAPTSAPDKVGPFIMNPEGVSRLFTRGMMRDGPFPVHYEPFESPVDNLVAPGVRGNPVARVFKDDFAQFAAVASPDFPYAATSYRLTEHFHYWTKHNRVNAVLQPEFFVELSEQLGAEKGIEGGDWVRVWSKRGEVRAKAVVTKRLKPMTCDGKIVHGALSARCHGAFRSELNHASGDLHPRAQPHARGAQDDPRGLRRLRCLHRPHRGDAGAPDRGCTQRPAGRAADHPQHHPLQHARQPRDFDTLRLHLRRTAHRATDHRTAAE